LKTPKTRACASAAVVVAFGLLGAITSAHAGTYVYISNADDGDIASYELVAGPQPALKPGKRYPTGSLTMPMAVSPDGSELLAAVRSKPTMLQSFRIDPANGELQWRGATPLPESMVYVSTDRTGEWLLQASYGGNTLGVSRIEADGRITVEPAEYFPSGGTKPHSILVDATNQFVYVPHLATDEIRMYRFNAQSDQPLTPLGVATELPKGYGPRHFVFAKDNRFLYVLTELTGRVLVFERDLASGTLRQIQDISSLPPDTPLVPGQPRVPTGTPGAVPFDESKAIFCAEIKLSPDGRSLYTSERTLGTLSHLRVDPATGRLRYVDTVTTEPTPRGFNIDPSGRFLVAAGQKSDTVSLYAIGPTDGNLRLLGKAPSGKGANWVSIVKTD